MWRRTALIILGAATFFSGPATAGADTFGLPAGTAGGTATNAACAALITLTSGPADQPVVAKSVVRSDRADGSSDFRITLTGAMPSTFSSAAVLDCTWIDVNGNGQFNPLGGESMRSYTLGTLAIGGTGSNRTLEFEVNVPGAVGKQVCDRGFAASTGTNMSSSSGILTGLLVYSEKACTAASPPAEVPETRTVALLVLSGGLTGIAALGFGRVRRRLAVA